MGGQCWKFAFYFLWLTDWWWLLSQLCDHSSRWKEDSSWIQDTTLLFELRPVSSTAIWLDWLCSIDGWLDGICISSFSVCCSTCNSLCLWVSIFVLIFFQKLLSSFLLSLAVCFLIALAFSLIVTDSWKLAGNSDFSCRLVFTLFENDLRCPKSSSCWTPAVMSCLFRIWTPDCTNKVNSTSQSSPSSVMSRQNHPVHLSHTHTHLQDDDECSRHFARCVSA